MTTYSRGMGRVQLALSHLQQELYEDRASLGLLPLPSQSLSSLWKSYVWAERWRGLGLVSGGLAGSGEALSYTPEELWWMEAGRLDICFLWAEEMRRKKREISTRQGGFRCFPAYKWLPYSSFAHAHISYLHIMLQTALEYKLLHANEGHWVHILQRCTFSILQPICVMLTVHIFLCALTKTRRMSRRSHYSHKDGCCSSNIAQAAAQWLC